MNKHRFLWAALVTAALAMASPGVHVALAQGAGASENGQETSGTVFTDRVTRSVSTLEEIMRIPEQGIPDELLARAHAIAVIPHTVEGAFGVGGRFGRGLMSQRSPDGDWSPPSFIYIGGGSFGLQIGIQSTDLILVFTNNSGVESLMRGQITLGADASATAGPVGRHAAIGTDILLSSAIFSYSRSKGLFAGISLEGAVMGIDDTANEEVYERQVTAEGILFEGAVTPNPVVQPFIDVLNRYSPPRPQETSLWRNEERESRNLHSASLSIIIGRNESL